MLPGETAQAAGTETDAVQMVSETAENPGAARRMDPAEIRRFISAEIGGLLVLGDTEIEIPPGALAADTEIGISRLLLPADTGEGLVNVTAGGGAYRFEPAGLVFNKAVTIRMGYDSRLEENEPALEHSYTYFYDTEERRWEKLERLNLDRDRRRIISLTTHFTDMINGTLTLPESPKPLQFDINSIKGLEAADPDTGVLGLERLEADNSGAASFQFELNLPSGRNGMAPRVAVAYSSDGGNGVMGRGFDLRYGSRIAIDTRWGLPQYDGRDAYMLDGVKLRETGRTESVIQYQPERETRYELIEHYYRGPHDYWMITSKTGARRIYGKRNEPGRESWTGDDAARKYSWELEEERDLYGNTIRYNYEQDQHYPYIKKIRYTNYQDAAGMDDENGSYTVEFDYRTSRQDIQVDGRGKFLSERKWLLERITAKYNGDPIRTYLFTYKENYYGIPQLEYFGEEDPAEPGEYWWRYGFTYEEPKKDSSGQYSIFGPQETWDLDNGLHVQQGVSGGASGTAAMGIGVAHGYPFIDRRITGGGHGGVSAGMNQSRQTMVDINGDGRPDNVRRVLQGLMVSLNLGDRFGREHLYEIDMPGLDESDNLLASYGWNAFAGWGFPAFLGSLGYSYAETKQNGWTDTNTDFTDIDGDGVADIAVQGNHSYYRNTSHETGRISFEKMPLVKITGERIEDILEPLSDAAKAGYNRTYFRQLPFRAWRPPYTGRISVAQNISAADAPGGDGIAAKTYAGNDDEADAEFLITGSRPAWTAEETRRSYRMDAGEPLYFIGDPLWDTRGDDLVWNITVNYEIIRYFEDMDKQIRYLPEESFSRLPAERLEGPLRAIYTETPNKVITQYGQETVSYTYTIKAHWETASSPPDDLDEARRILIRRKRFVPGLVLAEDFDLLLAAASGMDEEAGAGTNYYEALCTYYMYDAGNRRYYVNQGNRSFADKTAWENLEETLRTLVENCDDDGISALAGYRWNKAAPVLTHYDPVRRRVYHQESDEAFYERVIDVPGYQNGAGRYLYLDEIEGSVLKLDLDAGMIRQNVLSLETAVLTPGTGGDLTVELPGEAYTLIYRFGGFEAAAKILYQEELDWIREAAEEAGESWETITAQLALYYEPAPDGTYLLREGQENISWVVSFSTAYKLGSWRSVERIIRYYADGEYPVQHKRLQRLTLDNTGYRYETVDLEDEGLAWNSGEDYSPENLVLSPLQYYISAESSETGGTEPVDREMAVAECLYGGVRQWYYGIWTGDQPGKIFSGAAIEEQRNSTADSSNITEMESTLERDIGKIEDTLGKTDQPLEEGMIETQDQGPVYLQIHENRSDGGVRELVRDSGTGRTVAVEALIGNVSTRVQNRLDPYGEVDQIIETYAPYIEGDRVHPERLGGNVFYEIPGIVEETGPAGDGPGPMRMVTIRKSVNEGTDIVSGLNLSRLNEVLSLQEALANITATASGVSNDKKDYIQKIFALATFSRNTNINNSYMTQDVQDINGDGIADIVQSRGSSILVTPGSREGFRAPYSISGSGSRLSVYRSESRGSGGVPGSLGSQIKKISSSGALRSESVNGMGGKDNLPFSGGITYADGTSVQRAGLTDINGDGLLDYIGGDHAGSVSTGENFKPYESFTPGPVSKSEMTTIGGSFAISDGLGNTSIESTGSGYVVNGGVSYSVSVNQTTEILLDINGDGLPDKIKKPYGSGDFTIYLNQGNCFMSEPVSAKAASWDLRAQDHVMFQGVTDGNILTGAIIAAPGVSEGINGILDIPVIGNALKQLETDDLLNSADDKGIAVNPFGYFINNYINSLNLDTTISLAVNTNAQIIYMGSFWLFPSFFTFLNISAGAGGGTNLGADLSGVSVRMMDINGDGFVDRVLRIPGSDHIYVRLNLLGEVGLLKRIDLPQGGAYDLQYAWMPGTSDMPQGRYVLAELTANDGNEKPGYKNLPYGEHTYTISYTYGTGRYDRKVKEFYGFDQVTAAYAGGSKKIMSYYNGDYYSKGMIKSETIQDSTGTVLRFVRNEIDGAPYARFVSQNRLIYEAGSSDPVEAGSVYQYDRYGNIRLLEEYADGTEKIRAEIRYQEGDNPNYLHAHPLEITVYGSGSGLLRRRSGSYNWDTGSLVSLTVYTDQNTSSISEFTWDQYGNLERIKDSRGAWTACTYDGELHQYVEQIRRGGSGAGPYVSYMQWNKKYGIRSAETDENGNVITYIPDIYGRTSEIWSPYDHYNTGGRIPSVRYGYFTGEGTNWYSVTENKIGFDYLDEKKMTTVMMLDGLGRNLYTAKQGEQRDDSGDSVEGWNISGAAAYDRKGRLTEEGQNQFVKGDLVSLMAWTGGSLKHPVISAYDSLDRPVEKLLPDGSLWSYNYGIAGGRSYTRIQDPLGNRNIQEKDGRDNIVRVSRYDNMETEPLTSASYRYNGIGELLEALDHADNPLRVEYDLAGRRIAIESRDLGRKEYRYDEAGNLAAERDSVLQRQGKWITYAYDGLNRLTAIRYPKRDDTEGETETVYTYGLPGAAHNSAGRITGIRDESGDTSYRYGLLGEMVWEGRRINTMDVSRNEGAKFKAMSYTGNYLGQTEQIIYPDGEKVQYEYDHGGQIRRVTGLRENARFV
ncbi:MAG: hypothetical protein LBO80_01510, partial [Treponema sp.]|nr:hypothetical protein [Treponema sp.]